MKKERLQNKIIEELERTPIVQIACDKVGVSRNSFYRWMKEDPVFLEKAEEAISLGVGLVHDVAESNVLSGLKAKDPMYTKYWLSHRHPNYRKPFVYRVDANDPLEQKRILDAGAKKIQLEKEINEQGSRLSAQRVAEKTKELKQNMSKWFKEDDAERRARAMFKQWKKDYEDKSKK